MNETDLSQDFFDLSPVPFCIFNTEGIFEKVNPAFAQLLGYNGKELLGGTVIGLAHPDNKVQTASWLAEIKGGKLEPAFENRYVKKNGCDCWLLWTVSVRDGLVYAVCQDISDRKQLYSEDAAYAIGTTGSDIEERKYIEEKLKNVQDEKIEILESISDSFFALDKDWKIVYWNRGSELMSEKKREKVLGSHFWDSFPHLDRQKYQVMLEKIFEEQEKAEFEHHNPEKDRWYDITVYPSRSGFSIYYRDITEQKKLQSYSQQMTRRLELLVKSANILVWELEAGSEELFWFGENLKSALGFPPYEDIIPTDTWVENVHPDDKDIVLESWSTTLKNRDSSSTNNYRFKKRSGEYIHVSNRMYLEYDEQGKFQKAIGVLEDITPRILYEDALQKSERNYKTLFQQAPLPQYIFDPETLRILNANDAALKHYGYSLDEFLSMTVMNLKPEERHESFAGRLKNLRKTRDTTTTQNIQVKKSGERMLVETSCIDISLQDREVRLATVNDITERERMEQQLKDADQKIRGMLISSDHGILLLDIHFRLVLLNKAAKQINKAVTGEEGEIGQNVYDLCLPEYKTMISRIHRQALKGRKQETEILLGREGEKKWYHLYCFPVKNEENEIIGICITLTDISDRKQAEAALEHARQEKMEYQFRLQSILNNTPQIVFIKDLEGRYLLVNKSLNETMGRTEEQMIGKTDFDFEDPELAGKYRQIDQQVISTLQMIETEEIAMTSKGIRHLLIVKFPLFDKNNQLYGVGGICSDFTEKVEYREKLLAAKQKAEAAERLQEEFLANMSHEIRTPMNGIIGMANILMETSLNTEQRELVQILKQSSDNLLLLINDVLDLSKIKAGKLEIEKNLFNLSEILKNILAPFHLKAREKGIALVIQNKAPVALCIHGDRLRLHQVLTNLVSNALKFTDKGEIRLEVQQVSLTREMTTLQFSVSDTGIGIPSDKLATIFESFVQADSGVARKFGGTGLGLSITKKLIELQGGEISVNSVYGAGTTFTFTLSFMRGKNKKADAKLRSKQTGSARLQELAGKRILVVEDNEVNRKVLMITLQKVGILSEAAFNGREAVAILEAGSRFDGIIMDLQMPEMNGFQTTAYIREKLKLEVPIIAMTANALRNERLYCLELGMNEYLSKPFVPDELFGFLNRLLLGKRGRRRKKEKDISQQNSAYNLSMLKELDDPQYFCEILQMFLSATPLLLKEIKNEVLLENWDLVSQKAHKLKSSLGLLQMNQMLALATELESGAKERVELDSMALKIHLLGEVFELLQPLLEAELKEVGKSMAEVSKPL